MYTAKQFLKYHLGMDVAGRNLAVFPDDTFLVSYPRSGNTWTRFLVGNLLHPQEAVSFDNIERLIPDAEAQSSTYLRRIPRPRVIKTHQYFDHRYPRVIYIVRDPRDVAVSYYHFARKYRHITDQCSLQEFVFDFVHGRLNSASWGTWAENVGTWLAARDGDPRFLLLTYEDLSRQTETELRKIAGFLGVDNSPQRLRDVCVRSSAERMRELEKSQSNRWISTKNKRSDIPFIGSASAGQWKSALAPEAVSEIEAAWGALMVRLGYELTTNSRTECLESGSSPLPSRVLQPARSE